MTHPVLWQAAVSPRLPVETCVRAWSHFHALAIEFDWIAYVDSYKPHGVNYVEVYHDTGADTKDIVPIDDGIEGLT